MQATRRISRRSFLGRVTGGASLVGSIILVGSDAGAFQVTDCDAADPGSQRVGTGLRTGVTDRDVSDRPNCGRGGSGTRAGIAETGFFDCDAADPGNGGAGRNPRTGFSDSDASDRAQCGRAAGSGDEAIRGTLVRGQWSWIGFPADASAGPQASKALFNANGWMTLSADQRRWSGPWSWEHGRLAIHLVDAGDGAATWLILRRSARGFEGTVTGPGHAAEPVVLTR